jgi:hypothetical protein
MHLHGYHRPLTPDVDKWLKPETLMRSFGVDLATAQLEVVTPVGMHR